MDILLAEDNRNFGLIMKTELECRGFSVDLVHDGLSAVSQFSRKRYDAVLLDMKMPEMNGIDALKMIKELSPATLSIMFSGNASSDEKQNALSIGAIATLDKPFQIENLIAYLGPGSDQADIADKFNNGR